MIALNSKFYVDIFMQIFISILLDYSYNSPRNVRKFSTFRKAVTKDLVQCLLSLLKMGVDCYSTPDWLKVLFIFTT